MSRPVVIKRCRWQFGDAVTLPWFGKTYIWYRRESLSEGLERHERCHAGQIEENGVLWYVGRVVIWRSVWGLIHHRSPAAKTDPVEVECYRVQYPDLTEDELMAKLRGG